MNNSIHARLRTAALRRHKLACIVAASMPEEERSTAIAKSEAKLTRELNHLDMAESRASIERPIELKLAPVESSGVYDFQAGLILDARHIF